MNPSSGSSAASSSSPRRLAWVILVASGVSVLVAGVVYTALVMSRVGLRVDRVPGTFWWALALASVLTLTNLALRWLRWAFLLRRSGHRVPVADSLTGYLSGFSLLFAPLLLGEMAVRAAVHRARNGLPLADVCVLNAWERLFDVLALASIAALAAAWMGWWFEALTVVALLAAAYFSRQVILVGLRALARTGVGLLFRTAMPDDGMTVTGLLLPRVWVLTLAVSVAAWVLPAAAMAIVVLTWTSTPALAESAHVYVTSSLAGAISPGGVFAVGTTLLSFLTGPAHMADSDAALVVMSVRTITAGVAIGLGACFLYAHFRSRSSASAAHFDDIADVYTAQIPEARRLALLTTKTTLMKAVIEARGAGRRGLDVGCGQGWYVARMRELGFDVTGMDDSAGQVEAARRQPGLETAVFQGSMLAIPSEAGTYDFVYCINVLHHLPSVEDQRRAFAELERVLRPGGLLFVHEINTRNPIFRLYMGYLFPVINCIDEGVERWILPNRLGSYTAMPVVDVRYFTFLPEFLPQWMLRLLAPLERRLEASGLRPYSAHYMAVLQRGAGPISGLAGGCRRA